jgi:hypothetical protein
MIALLAKVPYSIIDVPSEELQTKAFGKTNPVGSNTLLDGTDIPEGRALTDWMPLGNEDCRAIPMD